MNTNELNKWIDNSPYTEQEEVIVLLRQQQAEIEALKAEICDLRNVPAKNEPSWSDIKWNIVEHKK